jgi:uncharacterized protein YndB with AHSA1/START domain
MTIPAVRKSILVDAPVEQAFRAFTEGIAAWWPLRTHSVARERAEGVVFEGREGGRLYERTSDGEEHEWGVVLAWEPPSRVLYSWHPGRGDETSQEVEMRFTADGDGTRVEVEHRGWERLGERGREQRSSYDSGWDYVLGLYVENAGRSG